MNKISVILPTYKEKENIAKLIESIRQEFRKIKVEPEIIVVDDNSPDDTAGAVRQIKDQKNLKLFVRTNEKGLPTAVLHGMKKATGDYISVLDTDFSHPPVKIVEMYQSITKDSTIDLVTASRWVKDGGMQAGFKSVFFSKVINILVSFAFGMPYTDYTGGFFVVSKSTFSKISDKDIKFIFNKSHYGEYFIKMLYYYFIHDFKVSEIPFVYKKRVEGTSKTSVIADGIFYLKVLTETKKCLKH